MTLPENGTLRRIVAGVVTAIIVFLIGAVVASQNRITAVEVRVQSIEDLIRSYAAGAETNRIENKRDHERIQDTLNEIAKELRK